MKCKRCEQLPSVSKDKNRVYLKLPTFHHEPMLESFLKSTYTFQKVNDYYIIHLNDFETLIFELSAQHNKVERKDITIFPFNSEYGLTFEHLDNVKALSEWLIFYQSKTLSYIKKNRSLVMKFQPIYKNDMSILGYEALMRGIDEKNPIIAPSILFNQAKQADLLFNLDQICRQEAAKGFALKKLEGKLFINFLPTSIYDPKKCLKSTDQYVDFYNVEPSDIVFEVVETEFIKDFKHLKTILDYYKASGDLTASDDVGSGYSIFETISNLNLNIINIDASITKDIHKNKDKQSLLESYISIAKTQKIKVLVEGVKTKEELTFLKHYDIDYFQGYYLSRPL